MKTLIAVLVAVLVALAIYFTCVNAAKAEDVYPQIEIHHPTSARELIRFYSAHYGVSEAKMLDVAKRESTFNNEAVGDHGLARGIYQFHFSTFESFKKQMGKPELSYNSMKDQIQVTAWAFSKGLGHHWTTY